MSETVSGIAQLGSLPRERERAPEDAARETAGPAAQLAASPESSEERFCRICYSFESPLGSYTDLISPCGCKGTVKYVHGYCLRVWRFKGKPVKDIKVCEQCSCEYVISDEKKASSFIVGVSTISIMLSLLLATNLFITSTADTLAFIVQDVSAALYGGRGGQVPFGGPIIICNMDKVAAEKHSQRLADDGYVLHKVVCPDGREHYAGVAREGVYSFKNLHLFDVRLSGVFPSVTVLGLGYAVSVERTSLLLVNFLLSLWRLLSFGLTFDWAIYGGILLYTYLRMFQWLYQHIDSYCMYMVNTY